MKENFNSNMTHTWRYSNQRTNQNQLFSPRNELKVNIYLISSIYVSTKFEHQVQDMQGSQNDYVFF